MTQRLPIPGSDNGTWGAILNDFLDVSLASDGTLNSGVVGTPQLQNNAVTNAQLDGPTQATLATVAGKYTKPVGGIPASDLNSSAQTAITTASTAVQSVNTKTGPTVTLTASDVAALPTSTPLAGLANTSGAAGASNNQVLSYDSSTSQWVATTGINLDNNATDIHPLGVQAAGSIGKAADSGHVHTMPSASQVGALTAADNLSDVISIDSSRANLHVGLLGSAQAVSTTNIASLSGLPTVDSYALQNSDIVLLVGQTTQSQNGPWQMPASGSGAWNRPGDYATGLTMRGRLIEVNGGTQWAQTVWAMASTSQITVDSTATTWQCLTLPNPANYEGYWMTNDGVNPVWSPAPTQSVRAQNAIFRFSGGLTAGAISESYHIWDAGGLSRGPQIQSDEPSSSPTTLQVDIQYETSPGSGWTSIFGSGPFPTIAANTTLVDGSAPTVASLTAGCDLRSVILQSPPGPSSNPSAASFVATSNGNSGSGTGTSDSPTIPGTPQAGDIIVLVISELGSTISLPPSYGWTQYAQEISSVPLSVTGCSTTISSNQLIVSSGTGIATGYTISGSGIPTNTTVSSIVGTTVTMSNNATATASGLTITFSPPIQSTLSMWAAPWASGISASITFSSSSPAAWWVGLLRGGDSTTVSNSIVQTAAHTDGDSPGLGTGTVTGVGLTAVANADIVLVMASARYNSGSNGYTLSASGGPSGLASSADIVTSRTSATNVGLYVGIASAVSAEGTVAAATFTVTGGSGGANNIADAAITALLTRVAGTTGPSVCTIQQPIDD